MTKKLKALLLVQGSSFSFFVQGGTKVFQGTFPPEAVKNLEVIDRAKVTETMKAFFTTNAIGPSAIVLVLGEPLLFTKDILFQSQTPQQTPPVAPQSSGQGLPAAPQQSVQQPQQQTAQTQVAKDTKKPPLTPQEVAARKEKEALETQRFLDNVPIENLVHKTISIENGVRLIVTNADFIESLQQSVFALGSLIDVAIPSSAFANVLQGEITVEKAQQVLIKEDEAKQQNFLEVPKVKMTHATDGPAHAEAPQKTNKMRLFMMLGVFGVLIIVTIIMFVLMMQENARTLAPKVTPTPAMSQAVPSPTPVASESAAFSQSTRVQLLHNSSSQQQVVALTTELQGLGIRQITTQATATTGARLSFASSIPESAREQVTSLVRNIFPAVIVSDMVSTTYDIMVSF